MASIYALYNLSLFQRYNTNINCGHLPSYCRYNVNKKSVVINCFLIIRTHQRFCLQRSLIDTKISDFLAYTVFFSFVALFYSSRDAHEL